MLTEEQQHKNRDEELMNQMQIISTRLTAIEKKMEPISNIFDSVTGFNRIAIWVLKLLAGIGTALLGLYAIIEFFRRVARP